MPISQVFLSNTFNEFRQTTNLVIDEINALTNGTGVLVVDGTTPLTGTFTIDGNLLVTGETTTVVSSTLSIQDNMIYLNYADGPFTITNVTDTGTAVTYTIDSEIENTDFQVGWTAVITGVNPSAYNISGLIDSIDTGANSFTILSTATGTYVNGGTVTAKASANVDLGWAGGYQTSPTDINTYAHAGIFRDATDGVFKIYEGYTLEPDAQVNIDTTHSSFSYASVAGKTFTSNNVITDDVVADGNFVIGKLYNIVVEGTTVWTEVGATTGSAGEQFEATATGSTSPGTGTAREAEYETTAITINSDFGDIVAQRTYIDFVFTDDNSNETPQVRIGAQVGDNDKDALGTIEEGQGAFVIYTNNADSSAGPAGASLAERMRVDHQGNVGIGTNSPTEQLDVQLNAIVNESGAGDYGLFVGPSGFAGSFVYKATGDAEIAPRSGKSLLFAASTGGSERLRIDQNGNLLVGTTSESTWESAAGFRTRSSGSTTITRDGNPPLYVNRLTSDGTMVQFQQGTSVVGSIGSHSGGGVYLYSNSGSTSGLAFWSNVIAPSTSSGAYRDNAIDLGASGGRFKDLYLSGKAEADTYQFAQNSSATGATEAVYRPTTGEMAFKTNSSEAMRIDSSGNVGLKNSSPSSYSGDGADLVIGTTGGDNGLSIISGTSGTGNIYFGDVEETGTGSRRGQIVYDHATDHMRFATAASEAMRIDNNGKVLVAGSTALTTSTGIEPTFQIIGQSAATGSMYISRDESTTSPAAIYGYKSRNSGAIVLDNDSLFSINVDGSDGVGPIRAGTIRFVVDGTPATNDIPTAIVFERSDGAAGLTESMRIDGAGNVGIGTVDPSANLHISTNNTTTTNTATFRLEDTDTTTLGNQGIGRIEFYGNDSSGAGAGVKASIEAFGEDGSGRTTLKFSTANAVANDVEAMRIDSSGRVGIGAATPATQLNISSNLNPNAVFDAEISGTTLTVTAVTSGTITVGDRVTALNVLPNTKITALGTGLGGTGTYTIDQSQTRASTTMRTQSTSENVLRFTDEDTTATQGNQIGTIEFYSSDANGPGVQAFITAVSNGSPTGSLSFGTSPDGSTEATERMVIDAQGETTIYNTLNLGNTSTQPGDLKIYDTGNNALQILGNDANSFLFDLIGTTAIGSITFDNFDVTVNKTDDVPYDQTSPVGDLILSRKNTGNNTDQTVGIRFEVTGWEGSTTGAAAIEAIQNGGDSSSADLAFITRSAGTYAEKVRIQHNGNVGIGTDSPQQVLQISQGANATATTLRIENTDTSIDAAQTANAIEFYTNDASTGGTGVTGKISHVATNAGSTYALIFSSYNAVSLSEAMRIGASGSVTINSSGTIPTGVLLGKQLVVGSSTGAEIIAFREDTSVEVGDIVGALLIGNSDTDGTEDHFVGMWGKVSSTNGSQDLHFAAGRSGYEGDVPQMTLDSNGALLLGQTTGTIFNQSSVTGVTAAGSGSVQATTSAGTTLFLNRLSSDGQIVGFYKDGAQVGGIGTIAGDLTIGDDDIAIRFDTGTGLVPWDLGANATGGLSRDAAIDIGVPSARFKDLYLSGSVITGSIITPSGTQISGTATTTTTAATTIISYAIADYSGAELTITATDTVTKERHITKLLTTHDVDGLDPAPVATQYASVFTTNELADFDVIYNGLNVEIQVTSSSTNETDYVVMGHALAVIP